MSYDSAIAWPVLAWLPERWGIFAEFHYHIVPLPNHRNSYLAAKVSDF